jgi:hypothetical protein
MKGVHCMSFDEIGKLHPNRYVLAVPLKRNDTTGFVEDWQIVNTHLRLDRAEDLQEYYMMKGIKCAIVDTSKKANLPPNKVAQFFRVYFGMSCC